MAFDKVFHKAVQPLVARVNLLLLDARAHTDEIIDARLGLADGLEQLG